MLQLVQDNWTTFRRPKIIKKLPGLLRNTGDHHIVGIKYSVRNRFANDSCVWILIRKERVSEETVDSVRYTDDSVTTITNESIDIFKSLLTEHYKSAIPLKEITDENSLSELR